MTRFLIFAPGPSLDLYKGQDVTGFITIGMGGTCFYHASDHHFYNDPIDEIGEMIRTTQVQKPLRTVYQPGNYAPFQIVPGAKFFVGKDESGPLSSTLDLPECGLSLCFAVRLALGLGQQRPMEINILGCDFRDAEDGRHYASRIPHNPKAEKRSNLAEQLDCLERFFAAIRNSDKYNHVTLWNLTPGSLLTALEYRTLEQAIQVASEDASVGPHRSPSQGKVAISYEKARANSGFRFLEGSRTTDYR